MKITETRFPGLLIIEPTLWKDERGYFYESFQEKQYADLGITDLIQDNQSCSYKNVIRGLHAQCKPFEQGKLVRVIKGAVWDVAVDIRQSSPTYGQHFGVELNDRNHLQVWMPPGFLHGFATLEDETIFSYKVSNYYHKESEIGIVWNDPQLAIDWKISESEMIISEKDKILPPLSSIDNPF